uniref:SUN domain-containing protein n=1 Tax=Anopheles melas TaxID=34690 RepID=A0A182U9C8_9DIPT
MEILNDRLSLLEQLNFDKLGPTDYAARVFGGEVVSVVPTSRHRGSLLSRVRTAFSSMYDNYYQMQCIIQGINNPESTGKEIYFGTFTFDYMTTFLETFELDLDQPVPGVRFARVDIHSNHGEKFTCIYR